MLEILEQGRQLTNEDRQIEVCPRCGCKFSYTADDIQQSVSSSLDIDSFVICPNSTCSRYILVTQLNNVKS